MKPTGLPSLVALAKGGWSVETAATIVPGSWRPYGSSAAGWSLPPPQAERTSVPAAISAAVAETPNGVFP